MGRRRGKVRTGLGSWRGCEEVGAMPRKRGRPGHGHKNENHSVTSAGTAPPSLLLHLYNGDRVPSLKGQEENE